MAIIKLGELSFIKRGSSPRPINQWLQKDGLMWAKISDLNGNFLNKTKEFINPIWEKKGLIGKYGDLLITNSATPGIPFIQLTKKVAYHDGFLAINCNENLILKKYLFYKLIIDRPKLIKMGNGAVFINLSSDILKNWNVYIPNISIQQQIIDIIEPNEKLFLKYSNCVRIDSFENVQNDMKDLIDIIEPIEKLEKIIIQIINNIEKSFFSRSLNFQDSIKKNIIWKTNGYAYEGYEKINDGLYKIFTIKNIIDDFKFSRTNVLKNNLINIGDLVTGLSGTIGTVGIIFESDWVSNQRTLTLRSNIPLNLKIAIEKQVDFLLKNATGAVQKNITMNDILNLKTIEKKLNDELINKFYIKLLLLKNKIIKIKNCEIKLLIK
ncbi:restriction endonuclease subunit S [Spiroplasma platyhelix]|uniref:Type I restriction modification DNA specificity domain-containing protein n=1 Tax=Spiroplasma platyhelix PALS-1 TaxID=1276218 RepID=A0A846U9N7_9MOLU|nr:restriction endonuclease subunit S [Spiroplasma platyhelix]MBE4704210.1 hypothetical protein [Spiroplasma platyhelix PALS-1]NKE38583.1 hypothetical protein [Spiroplasma platyhelix PALS-1]